MLTSNNKNYNDNNNDDEEEDDDDDNNNNNNNNNNDDDVFTFRSRRRTQVHLLIYITPLPPSSPCPLPFAENNAVCIMLQAKKPNKPKHQQLKRNRAKYLRIEWKQAISVFYSSLYEGWGEYRIQFSVRG